MTTCSAPLDSRRFQSALLLLLGPLFIGVSFVLMLRRVEPVTTLFYLCAWYGIIWTLDKTHPVARRTLAHRPLRSRLFLLILFWSAVGWYAFELINFRLQNWYYIFVLDHPVLQTLNAVFSFATVFSRSAVVGILLGSARRGCRLAGPSLVADSPSLNPPANSRSDRASASPCVAALLLPAHLARLYPALGSHRIPPPAQQPAASISTRRLRPTDSPATGRIHRRRSVGILQLLGPS